MHKALTYAVALEDEKTVQTWLGDSWAHSCVAGNRKGGVMGERSACRIQTWPSVAK